MPLLMSMACCDIVLCTRVKNRGLGFVLGAKLSILLIGRNTYRQKVRIGGDIMNGNKAPDTDKQATISRFALSYC
jgi:hypothetical protein